MNWYVSCDVAMPRMISTSCITGTGFMKCMPITLCGRFVAPPSSVIEIDDVLLARIGSRRALRVERAKQLELGFEMFGRGFDRELDVEIGERRRRDDALEHVAAPFGGQPAFLDAAIQILRDGRHAARDELVGAVASSTSCPLCAATCAMPAPIWPAPTTRIFMCDASRSRRAPGRRRPGRRPNRSTRCRGRRRACAAD